MIKRIIHSIVFLLFSIAVSAQQDALFSQYIFNHFAVNPAFAGSRRGISVALLSRQQWNGLQGAPSTQTFSVHGPIGRRKIALGVNIINDKIGPSNHTGISGTYAYHLPMLKGKLSMAIRLGAYKYYIDLNDLKYQNPQFPDHNETQISSNITPDFNFGFYYYTTRFFVGIASSHLFPGESVFNNVSQGNLYQLKTHLVVTAGKAFSLHENILFKPSIMIKTVENSPANMDITTSWLFYKKVLFGISYRTSQVAAFITSFYITDYLKIGYSYDIAFNSLNKYANGSHEIFLGYDFSFSKSSSIYY